VLEPDPELDLRGADAATKLALVAGALVGHAIPVDSIAAPDLRQVDVEAVRERASRGTTTRLVGRATRDGELRLSFEEVPRLSPLAIPATRVAYTYELAERTVVHVGDGIGPVGTARAVLRDLVRLGAVREGGVA
jgi:homoserine dehydrogenase